MGTYKLRRVCKPAVLDAVDRALLFRFLSQFEAILAKQGIELTSPENLRLDELVVAFLNPDREDPSLADAISTIDEMATRHGMHELLETADEAGLTWLGDRDPTAAEVAMWVWLEKRDLFEEKHAQTLATRPRSFEVSFPSVTSPPSFKPPPPEVLDRLAARLGGLFEKRRHGRGCHVFTGVEKGDTWFLIRHGEPYRRERTMEKDRATLVFRPEAYDVVVYRPRTGELAINAGSKWEKDHYRTVFGEMLFDEGPVVFSVEGRYDLEPLRADGAACLNCEEIEGLDWVKLREIRFRWGGRHGEVEIRQARDLFEVYDGQRRHLPSKPPIIYAKFEVRFKDAKASRMLGVWPPSKAQYTRDGDREVLEEWLAQRGFIRAPTDAAA